MPILIPVISRPTVDFTAALAAAGGALTPPFTGSAITNLPGLPAWGSRRFFIRAISFTAVENIGLEFDFFSGAAGGFLSRYQFSKADGVQLNAAGLYNYYVDGLAIPYIDLDTVSSTNPAPPTLHVAIQNVDTTAKSADAAGAVAVTFWIEPMGEGAGRS
jgi:hypothetical protein